jgi:hypothetical protein
MSILGVESVVFGVEDISEHRQFWIDFGLSVEEESELQIVYRLPSGSRLILLRHGDSRLPSPDPFPGDGLKETVWGVSDQASLDRYAASLASEVAVTHDADGTVRCVCPDGQPIALRLWEAFIRQRSQPS